MVHHDMNPTSRRVYIIFIYCENNCHQTVTRYKFLSLDKVRIMQGRVHKQSKENLGYQGR